MILPLKEAFDPVYDTQRVFRLLLDSMARPGKINLLPDIKILVGRKDSFSYLIARTLLDIDVAFVCLDDENSMLEREIKRCTGARLSSVSEADFVFCDGRKQQPRLFPANAGNLRLYNKGATMVMAIDQLYDQEPRNSSGIIRVKLSGMGVDGCKLIWLEGIHQYNLEWMSLRNQDFSLGVDIILVDLEGKIACIPRSSRLIPLFKM